ncbi:VOC family protein [Bacillus sp. JCM 19034]|uniref:VOC family protein n=1 Tax=Bacillus sp. JCM 19034 TaxID=1481928 RepID=UPI000785E9F3|nr:VOC family protein [Bacillus sp. JCM 19034]
MTFQPSKTFINLPVSNLQKTIDFFTNIGFTFNPHFTDDNAACMVINDHTFAMLLTHSHFKNFTKKSITDTTDNTEVLIAFAVESREQVDDVVRKAIQSGGSPASEPTDHGFMYQASFLDLDGHTWELLYMEPTSIQ